MQDSQGSPKHKEDSFLFHFSSIKVFGSDSLVAAPMGKGVFLKRKEGDWETISSGLPDEVHVNRLHVNGESLFACTSKGLFEYVNEKWTDSELAIGCYQFKEADGSCWAATNYGLWRKAGPEWQKVAYSHSMVYDFMHFPEYMILALDFGIAIYDRLMGTWAEYDMRKAVTGLAVYQGHVLAITENGELLQGNKQGGFESIQFGNLFLFSIVTKGSEVFVCADRGLFRVSYMNGRMVLMSVRLGCPVTDIDYDTESLYLATLFEGIQKMERI